MKTFILGLFIFGLTIQIHSQTIELPETVINENYNYLNAVDSDDAPLLVNKLVNEVLNYKNTELVDLYTHKDDTFKVTFYTPNGYIIAYYNKKGEITQTIEKYNNVKLPLAVMQSVSKRFPNWGIVEDVYLVTYHSEKKLFKQEYKMKLKNNDAIITAKTDENGTFL